MEVTDLFERICQAMADPSFYPHPADRFAIRETHISIVFLAGDWAYKLKKPVDFGFLDFRTLPARRHFCEREVVLNQRLSHGVYAGVASVCRGPGGRFFLGEGEEVEVAVKMKRLPEERSLLMLLLQERVTAEDMKDLGLHLARFHAGSERSDEVDRYGNPEVIEFNMEENFAQLEPFVDAVSVRERWDFIREVSRGFFRNRQSLFLARVEWGRIIDGHGDLRAEHVYLFDGIQIIDCIEFNDRFRYGDAASDLAYLTMDLEYLRRGNLIEPFLTAYVDHSRDYAVYSVLDFYSAYRAIVKMKVDCLRSIEVADHEEVAALMERAGTYAGLAYGYAVQFSRPTLWVLCGLPATGKSTLAEALGQVFSIRVLASDRVRKEELGLGEGREMVVPYGTGIYRSAMRQRVYSRMLAMAQEDLKNGRSVVLDAGFSRVKWRREARQLALDLDTGVVFVECVCPEATIRDRLQRRRAEGSLSDARVEHLADMIQSFEPLSEAVSSEYFTVDTGGSLHRALVQLLAEGYRRRCEQVKALISR